MSTLHTISKSWHDATWLYEQLAFAAPGDAVLLIQDAVLAAHSPIALASFIAKCKFNKVAVFVLQDDCRLRGVVKQYPDVLEIDYAGFVDLAATHDKKIAW